MINSLQEIDNQLNNGVCSHKQIWPLTVMDFLGTFVLITIMALATMGGIGGGGVVVLII